jgi:hypothetical protein
MTIHLSKHLLGQNDKALHLNLGTGNFIGTRSRRHCPGLPTTAMASPVAAQPAVDLVCAQHADAWADVSSLRPRPSAHFQHLALRLTLTLPPQAAVHSLASQRQSKERKGLWSPWQLAGKLGPVSEVGMNWPPD